RAAGAEALRGAEPGRQAPPIRGHGRYRDPRFRPAHRCGAGCAGPGDLLPGGPGSEGAGVTGTIARRQSEASPVLRRTRTARFIAITILLSLALAVALLLSI